jgi:ABC-2 type transport system permease protein
MVSALVYLQYHSIINRVLLRFKRLRQPKYLLGGIVGAIYFYFYFFRYLFSIPGMRHPSSVTLGSGAGVNQALYESIGAGIFLIAILLAWVLPHERAALAFSEAEVAFLFPAPISRRGLIHFKLMRSQGAILFTTFVLMLITNRFGGKFWIHAAGWWLILSTLNLHLLGSSFARTRLLDRGITTWRRRGLVLGVVLVAVVGVVLWARRTLALPDLSQMQDVPALQDYLEALLTSGPLPWLLYPFRLLIRPYRAADAHSFFVALWPAAALMFLHYLWVVRSDVAFEEASVEASKRMAQKIAAVRSGNLPAANPRTKGRRAPFALKGAGSPVVALLWKNLISAGQAFTPRLWIVVATTAIATCAFLSQLSDRSDLVSAIGMAAAMLVVWSLFIGPQLLRQDLRQDLPLADVLKMYPVRGWELVLGEMLAPVSILTGAQWLLLLISSVLLWNAPSSYLSRPATLAVAAGAALIFPMLNLIILQIPNAAVVMFPAWFQVGKDRVHGIEVTGQRIIAIVAQLLVFCIALIPAVALFGAICYVVDRLTEERSVAILLASMGAAVVLAGEAALGITVLGRLFERFDLSAELPLP